jgi:signal transduction histidine kinase
MNNTSGLAATGAGEGFAAGLRRRAALNAIAWAYVLVAIPALAMFILMVTSMSLVPIGVGLILLWAAVPLMGLLAKGQRSISAYVLGKPIDDPYLPTPRGNVLTVLAAWAKDPARWRDFAWTAVMSCVSWTIAWLAVGIGLGAIWYALYPAIFALTDGALDNDYGFALIDTQGEAFMHWLLVPICAALWWWAMPALVRALAWIDRGLLSPSRGQLERRVEQVAATRAESIDHSAAELRRIERDLHDGAQARLVALGMNLGLAQELVTKDPEQAAALLAEARDVTTSALGDLRSVVRGIHPPVLADRGLAGALSALALDLALPVATSIDIPGRPPAPVESALYFATSELLANIGKHSRAHSASVDARYRDQALVVTVTDDGQGGADQRRGTGLAGVARRLAAFDGTITIASPAGGPTIITLEVPCELSSPKTTRSFATD